MAVDAARHETDEAAQEDASDWVELCTPLVKAFLTDSAVALGSEAVQVYGGHGYIREHGIEQILRDAKILCLYEGTNGIQAMDLIGRKVLGSGGKLVEDFVAEINAWCSEQAELDEFIDPLRHYCSEWLKLTGLVMQRAREDANEAGAAAIDYQEFAGYVTLAWFWARAAALSIGKDDDFHATKLATARFYFQRLLPRADGHAGAIRASGETLMALSAEQFNR